MNIIDWVGFIGVFMILLSYVLNVSGKLARNDLMFILLNLVGAGMACLASILLKYLPFIVLEGAWTFVSLFTLVKYIRTKQRSALNEL